MEKEKVDKMITTAAKTIFSYCRARTNSKEEAEDLSQDILLELLRTRGSFCNDKAFYGFMWAVAGNVYKNWCKKYAKPAATELDEHIPDKSAPLIEWIEKEADLLLLYRELSLLTGQHRKATILYYFDGLKISEISKSLRLSESMVKFLLFKSRKILKEGMNMERTRGDLSFNPGQMRLSFWAWEDEIKCYFNKLCEDNLIAQNILLACYNDRCTAEEISIQLGVAVPYLEKELITLCEKDVLVKKGGRYETAVVIFTKDFSVEAVEKTRELQHEIAAIIKRFLDSRLDDIRNIGFHLCDADENFLRWHITARIIQAAILTKYTDSLNVDCPTKYAGCKAWVWGVEDYIGQDDFVVNEEKNVNGDMIAFLDFSINGKMDSDYFCGNQNRVNISLDIARRKTGGFSENDMFEASELIKRGFADKTADELSLRVPVFTIEQIRRIYAVLDDVTNEIVEKAHEMTKIGTDLLVQHTPVPMKKEAENVGWLYMSELAATAPISTMMDNGTLRRLTNNEHPTTYIVLK